jgi:hypothetical protein
VVYLKSDRAPGSPYILAVLASLGGRQYTDGTWRTLWPGLDPELRGRPVLTMAICLVISGLAIGGWKLRPWPGAPRHNSELRPLPSELSLFRSPAVQLRQIQSSSRGKQAAFSRRG